MAPSHTNSWPFVPPTIPGYDFRGGSQAGNLGLMIGKRISDGIPVTGTLHQSRVLLQHEHRILKRLQIVDSSFHPSDLLEQGFSTSGDSLGTEAETNTATEIPTSEDINERTEEENLTTIQSGLVENGEYFNRIVEDFIDLDQEISILITRRLGPNLLSPQHHQFLGLDETDGYQAQDPSTEKIISSPFPDVYTFLIFCLKAACVLEALQKANLAHLALCPTALHWSPPNSDVMAPPATNDRDDLNNSTTTTTKTSSMNPISLYHDSSAGNINASCTSKQPVDTVGPVDNSATLSQDSSNSTNSTNSIKPEWVNGTKLRLFDFSHSKILSHERARAPNNIAEWQVPGFLEYHLQFLAPEQTGRAEAWMDHRTDIYGLGVTLFSLLTMQFPNSGTDSVQILQGMNGDACT
ncbi:hypothetical protein BGZ76_009349 [Entomortierella beljakovae]|nr:hypothetical protein BGZ76_009349 [Entomortierella beljakovae]